MKNHQRKSGFFSREQKASYIYLIKWILIALTAGIIGGTLVHLFQLLLMGGQNLFDSTNIPRPVWAVFGALIAGGLLYRLVPDSAGEGIPSYLYSLNHAKGRFSFKTTIMKLASGYSTLVSFGNGGVVGPLGRVSAGLLSGTANLFIGHGLSEEDRRTASICGLSASIAAIFHTPVGAGVFAVEIIQRARMGYKDLFPSILSSIVAVWFSRLLGWKAFYTFDIPAMDIGVSIILPVIALSLIIGVIGGFYSWLYSKVVRIFRRDQGRIFLKVVLGTGIAAFSAWFLNLYLMGTSSEIFNGILSNDLESIRGSLPSTAPIVIVLLLMFLAKMLFNCITVGSGMSAGFTGPSVLVGMMVAYASAMVLKISFGTAQFYALIAAGFSGILAATMNVPLAAAIMTIEIFGLNYSIPAGLAAIIGFQVNRYQTIYDYALAGAGHKSEEHASV